MDLQETYDFVVQHLRQQGRRSVNEAGQCEYLAPDGSRCAVGALIPSGHPALKPGLDIAVEDLLEDFSDLRALIAPTRSHLDLLISLQMAHDAPESWTISGLSTEGWRRLRKIAEAFYLDDSVTRPLQGAG